MAPSAVLSTKAGDPVPNKKPISYSNLLLGAGLNMFEVTTLGQPLEVTKTQMAANRQQTIVQAMRTIWGRGGVFGFFQGLIPWAWIEASTKGAVLLFAASEIEYVGRSNGFSPFISGMFGGIGGGLAQAYTTMGVATTMKTAEITRHKAAAAGEKPPGTMTVFADIWRREGIRGINKGVNAVALRQCTNWGSRMALSRLAETGIRNATGKIDGRPLSAWEKILASTLGGGLSCWNQPFEVVRVEMQSMKKDPNRPSNLSVFGTARYIVSEAGLKGLYRGVTPRICLGIWQTICMVTLADYAKDWVTRITGERPTASTGTCVLALFGLSTVKRNLNRMESQDPAVVERETDRLRKFTSQQPTANYTIDGKREYDESTICRPVPEDGKSCLKLRLRSTQMFQRMQELGYNDYLSGRDLMQQVLLLITERYREDRTSLSEDYVRAVLQN